MLTILAFLIELDPAHFHSNHHCFMLTIQLLFVFETFVGELHLSKLFLLSLVLPLDSGSIVLVITHLNLNKKKILIPLPPFEAGGAGRLGGGGSLPGGGGRVGGGGNILGGVGNMLGIGGRPGGGGNNPGGGGSPSDIVGGGGSLEEFVDGALNGGGDESIEPCVELENEVVDDDNDDEVCESFLFELAYGSAATFFFLMLSKSAY
jgi:hypothetical protein